MKRLSKKVDLDLTVATSEAGYYLCRGRGLKAAFKITTQEYKTGNVALLYARRMLSALLVNFDIKKGAILYSTSDFLPDVLPAYVLKLRNKNVKWVQVIHHIYENPYIRLSRGSEGSLVTNLIAFYCQRMSFFLIKRYADLIITVNSILKEQLNQLGFDTDKIKVNPNGVDLTYCKNTLPDKEIKYDVVFLGRLNPSKGIYDLICVWEKVCQKMPNAKLVVVGAGSEESMKIIVKKKGLDANVVFLGCLFGEKKYEVLRSSRLFLFPSRFESWGIVIAEAFSCGLPVVAYDLPAYKEVFENKLVTVPLGNVCAMAKQVIFLLENPEVAREMGEKGREFVKRYDWSIAAEKELTTIQAVTECL